MKKKKNEERVAQWTKGYAWPQIYKIQQDAILSADTALNMTCFEHYTLLLCG